MKFEMTPALLKDWKVLVVDDEADSLSVARILLEMVGAQVLTAVNGQEALDMALNQRPEFILTDLTMPIMNGWELLNLIKKNVALRDIPVIALTAHAMHGDREIAFGAGFHNYLPKPLQPETFVNQLLNLLIDVPALAKGLDGKHDGIHEGKDV
jgi:CheY-like chemotaxis protein